MTSESKPEPIFVDGLFIKDRNEKTPDFILASYSINVQKLQAWLATHQDKAVNGWLNIDIKKSPKGSKYAQLNTYQKPEVKANPETAAQFQFNKELPIVDVNADMQGCETCLTPGVTVNDGHDCLPF